MIADTREEVTIPASTIEELLAAGIDFSDKLATSDPPKATRFREALRSLHLSLAAARFDAVYPPDKRRRDIALVESHS